MSRTLGPVSGHHYLAWIETADGLVTVDSGWDVAIGQPHEGSSIEALALASEATGKAVTHVLLTHDHRDHAGQLPLLRQRWPALALLAHPASSAPDIARPLTGGERLDLGGIMVKVIASPGHSAAGDELSFYLPDVSLLFCGDVAQPQGTSYSHASGPSPVPFFHDGEAYRRTLSRLSAVPFTWMRTGHGDLLGPEPARQWLRVTESTVARIEEIALVLAERYPERDPHWLAERIYDQVAEERHLPYKAAQARKFQRSYPGESDYERFDLPGLLWFAREALGVERGA